MYWKVSGLRFLARGELKPGRACCGEGKEVRVGFAEERAVTNHEPLCSRKSATFTFR